MIFFKPMFDEVVGGHVVTAATTYKLALEKFVPLIGRLDIQRDPIKTKFYSRLEKDIVRGCVMPAVTVALIGTLNSYSADDDIYDYIRGHVDDGFILDGIQRLSTLVRASTDEDFDERRGLIVTFIIAPSRDKLLYRMITLNNGQKPMSARHQIDVLADEFFDFDDVGLNLVPEKGNGRVRAPDTFKKSDFIKGYIAYLSNSVSIDNQKIIEEKMDELIAARIIDSSVSTSKIEFTDVIELINRLSGNGYLRDWIRVQNNFIGFCVGAKYSLDVIKNVSIDDFEVSIKAFETAFSSINVKKVNIGKIRRELVSMYLRNYEDVSEMDEFSLLDTFSIWIS